MNSYTVKLMVALISLFVLLTVVSQIVLAAKSNYKTEIATQYSTSERVSFSGVYIRNETPVLYSGGGVISYPNPDGSKIAKNSVVAYAYQNEQDIVNGQALKEVQEELAMLSKVQNPGTTKEAQPEFLSALISEKYQSIAACSASGDYKKLVSERKELTSLMDIMQIVIEKESNYNARIETLQQEASRLAALTSSPIQTVTVEIPGYFVSYTDGCESLLSIQNLNSLTMEDIHNVIAGRYPQPAQNAIGKIIDGYIWKMVGIIDNSRNRFREGSQVQLNISSVSGSVAAVIEEIRDTDQPNASIVILSCENLNYNLVQHRVEQAEMLTKDYSGIKVPRAAIRFRDGVKGVYVKIGEAVVFKKLNIIFEEEDFVISKETKRSGDLLLYDEIIMEGISSAGNVDSSVTDDMIGTDSESDLSGQP